MDETKTLPTITKTDRYTVGTVIREKIISVSDKDSMIALRTFDILIKKRAGIKDDKD